MYFCKRRERNRVNRKETYKYKEKNEKVEENVKRNEFMIIYYFITVRCFRCRFTFFLFFLLFRFVSFWFSYVKYVLMKLSQFAAHAVVIEQIVESTETVK